MKKGPHKLLSHLNLIKLAYLRHNSIRGLIQDLTIKET